MIILNQSKFIEVLDDGLSFYDGKHQKIKRYTKQIWIKILEWYQIAREIDDIPKCILPNEEMVALREVLLTLHILKEIEMVPRHLERIYNFYSTYNASNLERISNIRVMIWGCGTVGTAIVDNLVKIGVKNFLLIDSDIVEEKNIVAQSIFQKKDIGLKKIEVIKNYVESFNIGKNNVEISDKFINHGEEFMINYQEFYPNFIIDCADTKDEELDIQFIKFAEQLGSVYMSTGYTDDRDFIFIISKNFDKFRMFMRNNWAISKRKYQISSNRGTIIDSQLLGSLGARSIINHVCALNQNDRVIEINLLDITMRDVPFR